VRRGEVRWYKFTKPDKRRPSVILTRNSAIDYLGEVTVAPITRTIRNGPSEVLLTQADGMPEDCAVNLHHIQTVSKAKLGGLITTLGGDRMRAIRTALLFALDLQ
jgi:mRNA interferase MazF